jgi:hypothetical protein
MARILITSALPYINGVKHLGNLAGSMLPADVYARFMRLSGHEVLAICATDEHGTPAELAAAAAGQDVRTYCDEQHEIQKSIGEQFALSWDYFGRTSSKQNAELTQHFLTLACERLNLQKPTITRANIRQLQDYHWPGNVRELQNVVERGAILSRGEKLILDLQKGASGHSRAEHSDILTEQQMQDLQVSNIIACLKRCGGRVSGEEGAAQLMGIKPTTLYSRIKKYGIVFEESE